MLSDTYKKYLEEVAEVELSTQSKIERELNALIVTYFLTGTRKDIKEKIYQIIKEGSQNAANISYNKNRRYLSNRLSPVNVEEIINAEVKGETLKQRISECLDNTFSEMDAYIALGLSYYAFIMFRNSVYRNPTLIQSGIKPPHKQYYSSSLRLKLIGTHTVQTAYCQSDTAYFIQAGYQYKQTHRGSNFECQICQDATLNVYNVEDEVLPLHPRCKCFYVPV